jgi:hypothetical protein
VDLGDAPGWASVGHKAMTVIHSGLAGGDSVEGAELFGPGRPSRCSAAECCLSPL